MNYKIFARKWRPQSFKKIIGQENVVMAICNSLSLGRIHHAWLFSGSRGVGKTTIARLLAKCLNCQKGITYTPCRTCITCIEIEKGLCLDFIEVDAASRTKVEEIKEILDNVYYSPTRGKFKIYLIDEVHMLSRHSFNAFLKILEEPPQHVKFILATTDINRIPNTIISRCLHFSLKILSPEKILHFLKYVLQKEKINGDDDALKMISYYSQGSMRDALNLIEQAISIGNGQINKKNVIDMLGIPTHEKIFSITFSMLKKNSETTISLLNDIRIHIVEWDNVLIEILRYLHHIAMIQSFPLLWKNQKTEYYTYKINDIKNIVNKNDIQLCYQIILHGRKELPFAPNPQIGVEMTLLRAINAIKKTK
ncbi:DNA polymerase III subunit gamma/tau [Buchnera aphidicola]|uniref:DNA polymerase III subunit gamma/tau n=1 Tax=Buchnera aphidicola TaxID=9 RepID=UPI0034643426